MGNQRIPYINAVKHRATRFYMGVGKYTPNMSLYGDMGWMPCSIKQWSNVFRSWSRFSMMNNNRLNKRVFTWANMYENNRIKNWHYRVRAKFKELHLDVYCSNDIVLPKSIIKDIKSISFDNYKAEWCNRLMCNEHSKLRTYRIFKNEFKVEKYIYDILPGKYRSSFAKFRCDVAPLRIETGRYENLPIENRICFHCCTRGEGSFRG